MRRTIISCQPQNFVVRFLRKTTNNKIRKNNAFQVNNGWNPFWSMWQFKYLFFMKFLYHISWKSEKVKVWIMYLQSTTDHIGASCSLRRPVYALSTCRQLLICFLLLLLMDYVRDSVCRFKSLSYHRHLVASPSFGGQLAEARRAAGASYLPSKRWRCC